MTDPNLMNDPRCVVCGNCKHSGRNEAGQLECRRHPPVAVGIPVSRGAGMVGGGLPMNWLVNAFYPPVRPDWTCGDFDPTGLLGN